MTAPEFKTRLANGDKLAVVTLALARIAYFRLSPRAFTKLPQFNRDRYADKASHILAALASAEAKRT